MILCGEILSFGATLHFPAVDFHARNTCAVSEARDFLNSSLQHTACIFTVDGLSIYRCLARFNSSHNSMALHSCTGRLPVPSWVCKTLAIAEEDVALLEVNSSNESIYKVMLDYIARYAVDVKEQLRKANDDTETKASCPGVTTELIFGREIQGRLSSLSLVARDRAEQRSNSVSWRRAMDLLSRDADNESEEAIRPAYAFGLGSAHLLCDGQQICILHTQVGAPVSYERGQGASFRTINLYSSDEVVLRKLAESVSTWHFDRNRPDLSMRSGKYQLFIYDTVIQRWESDGWKMSRSLDSIILPPEMMESIVKDFSDFNSSESRLWYIEHGVPYRRNYMFYGPPGVGKTSTIRALAGKLNVSACFLTLGDRFFTNRDVQRAMRKLPCPAMLIIEDVDSLFNEDRDSTNASPLTFSGLLNALDGMMSKDGIITVMTTNHIEKLDAALIRAGRVDRKFEFRSPHREQMAALFASFYPDAEKDVCDEFAEAVFSRREKQARSIATLQEHFIYTRGLSGRESLNKIDQFFKEFYPQESYDTNSNIYM